MGLRWDCACLWWSRDQCLRRWPAHSHIRVAKPHAARGRMFSACMLAGDECDNVQEALSSPTPVRPSKHRHATPRKRGDRMTFTHRSSPPLASHPKPAPSPSLAPEPFDTPPDPGMISSSSPSADPELLYQEFGVLCWAGEGEADVEDQSSARMGPEWAAGMRSNCPRCPTLRSHLGYH